MKIAAGEVIERPASVVKELVENSVDAGAQNISVEISQGGMAKIVISDDGEGMSLEELALAVERHSTSKIACGEDLFAISTMGFRGEALASTGAISVMTITTRTREAVAGSRLVVRGGEKGPVEHASSPVGTRIVVEDLFFNTPVRKKFLRSSATEFTAIAEAVQQHILARPGIRFKLTHNNKTVLVSPGTGSLIDAIASLAGTDIADNLLEVNLKEDGYTVFGFIAKPDYHRSNRAMEFFSVNLRPVKVRVMGSAVEKAFHTLLPVNRYPVVFLDLAVPMTDVDVNVHPAKREVKFADSGTIFRLVYRGCLAALSGVSSQQVQPGWQRGRSEWKSFPQVSPTDIFNNSQPSQPTLNYSAPAKNVSRLEEALELRLEGEEQYTILGQVFSTFLVVACPGELRLVDQHAAQERVLYEKFLGALQRGERPSQVVLPVETALSGRMLQFAEA